MKSTHYVVCFDIFNDKRRRRVVRFLSDYGYRIQYSVFAVDCNEDKLEKLKRLIKIAIDEEEDTVFIFPMIDTDWNRKLIIGQTTEGLAALERKIVIL